MASGAAEKALLRLAVLAVLLGLWQVLGNDERQIDLPTVSRTAQSFYQLIADGSLPKALLVSNTAMALGYVIAVAAAVPLALAMGMVPTLARALRPYLMALIVIPLIAVLPLVQSALGLGLASRVFVVFLFAFVYIVINTESGVSSLPTELREMGRSFGLGPVKTFVHIVLPHARPAIVAGLRIGLGRAVVGMVIAELFLVSDGIGSLLIYYRHRFDAGAVMAVALSLILEGIVLMQVTRRLAQKGPAK